MKLRITIFMTLAVAAIGLASCDNGAEEAAKKRQDSIDAAMKADSIHDADSIAKATEEAAKRKADVDANAQQIASKWWNNKAEDANGTRMFYKDGAKIPPARGRDAFTLGADGTWTWSPKGPADKNVDNKGTWTSTEAGKYTFTYEKECKDCPTSMEVKSIAGEKLVVQF